MKKKLFFMAAAIIMVAGTIFQTKAYRCRADTNCPTGFFCYYDYGICVPRDGGRFTCFKDSRRSANGVVRHCSTCKTDWKSIGVGRSRYCVK